MSLGYGKLLQFLTDIKKLLSGDRLRDHEVVAPPPRGLNPQKAHPMHLNAIAHNEGGARSGLLFPVMV
ncbi:MAG: hypothetical protein ACRCT1_21635 [Microcoleaceae cyanobacterium]|jgi:hypothetical protein